MKTDTGVLATVAEVVAFPVRTPAAAAKTPPAQTDAPANVRLVIEEDGDTGTFIYKTLDRETGEVILQLPREEVIKAIHSGEYNAGDAVRTEV